MDPKLSVPGRRVVRSEAFAAGSARVTGSLTNGSNKVVFELQIFDCKYLGPTEHKQRA